MFKNMFKNMFKILKFKGLKAYYYEYSLIRWTFDIFSEILKSLFSVNSWITERRESKLNNIFFSKNHLNVADHPLCIQATNSWRME